VIRTDSQIRQFVFKQSTIDESTGCWIWQGPVYHKAGYGSVPGTNEHIHRRAFVAFYQVDVSGKDVCHRCDNPRCVAPHHLFVGTRRQNLQDMVAKGRTNNERKFCIRGHDLSVYGVVCTNGRRRCDICHKSGSKRRNAERRGKNVSKTNATSS
jgi:hypothetical protein